MLINRIIGPRDFEVIRDQIGAILAVELLGQASMTYDELFEAPVYVQRSKPINNDETALVNVMVDQGDFSDKTVISADGSYTFLIDVVTKSPTTSDGRGDVLSALKAQRLAGVVMGILSDPQYVCLGFTPPFIGHSNITTFSAGTSEGGESTNTNVVRVTMNVVANQVEPGISAVPLLLADTFLQLNDNDNGLVFTFNA